MAPYGARMQNADRAVIEFITARPANYPVAGTAKYPHKAPLLHPWSHPLGMQTLHPLCTYSTTDEAADAVQPDGRQVHSRPCQ